MKNVKFILLAVIVVAFTGVYSQNTKTEILNVKVGFHCPNGKALLDKELSKLDGVVSAVADVATKIVKIEYVATKQSKESLVAAIEKIGYTTEFTKEGTEIKKACSHDNADGH